jgi:hypothetical protein
MECYMYFYGSRTTIKKWGTAKPHSKDNTENPVVGHSQDSDSNDGEDVEIQLLPGITTPIHPIKIAHAERPSPTTTITTSSRSNLKLAKFLPDAPRLRPTSYNSQGPRSRGAH